MHYETSAISTFYLQLLAVKTNSGTPDGSTKPNARLTVGLNVTAAPLQHSRHLSVDGVEAELGLGPPLRRAAATTRRLFQLQLGRVGELQGLQQAGLTVHEVGDGVDWQTTLQEKDRTRVTKWTVHGTFVYVKCNHQTVPASEIQWQFGHLHVALHKSLRPDVFLISAESKNMCSDQPATKVKTRRKQQDVEFSPWLVSFF